MQNILQFTLKII